jgi:para-aminobenzoate synthetase component 1
MREINFTAIEIVTALLGLKKEAGLCLLDSSSATHGNSHRLIAGIFPVEVCRISGKTGDATLAILNEKLAAHPGAASIFTISYDLGSKLENIPTGHNGPHGFPEPDIFIAFFESLIIHDYSIGKTFLSGDKEKAVQIETALSNSLTKTSTTVADSLKNSIVTSNFSRAEYLAAIGQARKFIHRGDTYQINLTQQLRADLPASLTPQKIFSNLRSKNPVPFAAFIERGEDTVISASPERFLRVENVNNKRIITVAPIKGTRPRGETPAEDEYLINELLTSAKDRAENIMIVDLLRNDIGRVCKFGTVRVEELCALEIHPTVFHLVSTIRGELEDNVSFSDLLRAAFPCGSITGAPKVRTMQIIDELEPDARGLSMGAIGYIAFNGTIDMNVAIRTMVVRDGNAIFNVGGGIVADSIPEAEYEETLVKAKALMSAINGKLVE